MRGGLPHRAGCPWSSNLWPCLSIAWRPPSLSVRACYPGYVRRRAAPRSADGVAFAVPLPRLSSCWLAGALRGASGRQSVRRGVEEQRARRGPRRALCVRPTRAGEDDRYLALVGSGAAAVGSDRRRDPHTSTVPTLRQRQGVETSVASLARGAPKAPHSGKKGGQRRGADKSRRGNDSLPSRKVPPFL